MYLQVGKLADLVLWKPSFFGAKPEMVIKGGAVTWANMGDPNASIPTPQPVKFYMLFLKKQVDSVAYFSILHLTCHNVWSIMGINFLHSYLKRNG